MVRGKGIAVALSLVMTSVAAAQPRGASSRSASVTGDLRVHELASRVFGNRRTLRVLLPPGYHAPANRARRYPVLYLKDGQNLFDRATATFKGGCAKGH